MVRVNVGCGPCSLSKVRESSVVFVSGLKHCLFHDRCALSQCLQYVFMLYSVSHLDCLMLVNKNDKAQCSIYLRR